MPSSKEDVYSNEETNAGEENSNEDEVNGDRQIEIDMLIRSSSDSETNERCILGTKGCNIHCLAKGKRYGRCKHGKCHCYWLQWYVVLKSFLIQMLDYNIIVYSLWNQCYNKFQLK